MGGTHSVCRLPALGPPIPVQPAGEIFRHLLCSRGEERLLSFNNSSYSVPIILLSRNAGYLPLPPFLPLPSARQGTKPGGRTARLRWSLAPPHGQIPGGWTEEGPEPCASTCCGSDTCSGTQCPTPCSSPGSADRRSYAVCGISPLFPS